VLYYIPQATKYVPMENEQQEKRDHFWNRRVGSSHTYNSSEHFRRNSTAPDTDINHSPAYFIPYNAVSALSNNNHYSDDGNPTYLNFHYSSNLNNSSNFHYSPVR
jgi:hypothetical protein